MTIHAWGGNPSYPAAPLYTSEIMAEFGDQGGRPLWLSHYYRGGARVPNNYINGAIAVADSEPNGLLDYLAHSMFYGASNAPVAGISQGLFCSGVNRYERFTNGYGGFYDTLVEANSPTCGYVPPVAPFSVLALNASFQLDYQQEFWINFVTGNVTSRYGYFNGNGATLGVIWNYTTGANTGNDLTPSGFVDEWGNPIMSYVQEVGNDASMYFSHVRPQNFIWKDGIGSSFAKSNLATYSSLNMAISMSGRGSLMAASQPTAGNGYVGYIAIVDHQSDAGSTGLVVYLNGS